MCWEASPLCHHNSAPWGKTIRAGHNFQLKGNSEGCGNLLGERERHWGVGEQLLGSKAVTTGGRSSFHETGWSLGCTGALGCGWERIRSVEGRPPPYPVIQYSQSCHELAQPALTPPSEFIRRIWVPGQKRVFSEGKVITVGHPDHFSSAFGDEVTRL